MTIYRCFSTMKVESVNVIILFAVVLECMKRVLRGAVNYVITEATVMPVGSRISCRSAGTPAAFIIVLK